ncbi:MAG TPA: glycosyltransferase family 4 protein [Candidatus Limnocylindria bacterium]
MGTRPQQVGRRALILVEDLPVPFDRRVWNEATTLRAAGWRVTVVCPKGDGARRWHERIDGIEIFRYPLPTTAAGMAAHLAEYAVAMPASLILAVLAWRGRRFDVVHACNPPDFFFPIGRLFRALGSAFVYDQHDLAPEVYVAQGGRKGGLVHRFLRWSERATYRSADAVIATNQTYRRFAIERGGVPAEHVHIVRSSPDPKRLFRVDPDPSLRDGRQYLVSYLGTMGPQDGVDLFVEAARTVSTAMPGQVRFVAMGGGNQLDALRALAAERGLGGEVEFTGRIPDEQVRRTLASTDVAVSPDPANDFNEYCTMNKTLEYMAMGVPVAAFDLEETRFSAGDAAVYARPNDPAELGRAVIELLNDEGKRAEMGRIGRERISGPLSWDVSAQALLGAYADAMARRHRS